MSEGAGEAGQRPRHPEQPVDEAIHVKATTSDEQAASGSSRAIVLMVVATIVAVIGFLLCPADVVQRAQYKRMLDYGVAELAEVADLVPLPGEGAPIPVEVDIVQEGGPITVRDLALETVTQSEYFNVGSSPHLIRIEMIEDGTASAMMFRLWRRGWDLRLAAPVRVDSRPWIPVLCLVGGAWLAFASRRLFLSGLVAGCAAQGIVLAFDWPALIGAPPMREHSLGGPIIRVLSHYGDSIGEIGAPILGALLVFCLMMVFFDHRKRGDTASQINLGSAFGLAGVGAGAVISIADVAVSRGYIGTFSHWAGMVSLVGVVMLWYVPAAYRNVKRESSGGKI